MTCPSCGTENREGRKFCSECGTALASACPSCGAANEPGEKFCGECGTPLTDSARPAVPTPAVAPAAERRLVSVLFADLVGFTTLSESRDSEDVRELLSRYFDTSRRLIELYGGTVEKFIGDAVMAVWGTPTATEDDAERAVRAALDLVAAVSALGDEIGASGLRARAGVLTGEAAVTIGAEGQGMVAGDLVNTASRIQSAAEPGTVLVGEATRRSTEQTIVYEEAGSFELKGKESLTPLWSAQRVVSGLRGSLKSQGLEPPFVGRDRELRLVKELFHASAEERKAHLVSVTGIAGIGKSRLAWEFYKYFDGIADTVYWHRGRCLSYGEGVTYWALADMVRMRCRIAEDEEPASARGKLQATLEEHILDREDRDFLEPRLANLLGLAEHKARDQQDLFAAWRLFFERLSEVYPTVLAFEDMQWADTSLLDFVEHLLEWSRDHPLFVVTLARPELVERRPTWGAGQRNFTSLYLEPLSQRAMHALLDGLVPGLPARLRDQILARAEGVPLYAVETVRMLLDKNLLVQDGPVYRPTGEIEALEVPETLQALIAARLDGLTKEERHLLQDGAVLGKTFMKSAAEAVSGLAAAQLEALLSSLVRKEVLGVQSDPRSPEHGQYGFLQDLVRHVAYETLSKRERKTRHLKAAAHLEHAFADVDEVAEVLASHYLSAYDAAPEAEDAAQIQAHAREMLTRAGDRAASLGAPEEAQRYFERAADLADDVGAQAALLERAGRLAAPAGHIAEGREQLERAIALYEQVGDASSAALASAGLGDIDVLEGKLEQAATRFEATLPTLQQKGPSAELATTLAQLGRVQALRGERERALVTLDRALQLAERLGLDDVLVHALTSRAIGVIYEGRFVEACVLLEGAVDLARERELHNPWFRAAGNLGVALQDSDRYEECLAMVSSIEERARQLGDREILASARLGVILILVRMGRWDEALGREDEPEVLQASQWARSELVTLARIRCERGELAEAERMLAAYDYVRTAEQAELAAMFQHCEARVLRALGRAEEALAAAERGLGFREELSHTSLQIKLIVVEALEAALALGDLDHVEGLLGSVESLHRGEVTPFLRGHAKRFRALLDARRGRQDTVDEHFLAAEALFREHGMPFDLACTELEHGEWLVEQGRATDAMPLLARARETFEHLRAVPWLERSDALDAHLPEAVTA
jgi:class 3 adenylate cyclase/tetratricopeptide (TPR) repeat protein